MRSEFKCRCVLTCAESLRADKHLLQSLDDNDHRLGWHAGKLAY